jgi:DNA-binding transcriptional ArsR family regulator
MVHSMLMSVTDTAEPTVEMESCIDGDPAEMMLRAEQASTFLKAMSHEGRLMILCYLSSGEKSVTELEQLLSSRQAAVSQQLARLRLEGLVSARRDGKAIYYSLSEPRAQRLISLLYEMFCKPE